MFLLFLALGIAVQPRKPAVPTRFTKKIALPKNYNNGIGCDMCTKVIQYVEQLLKDQTVESEIATLVEQLCNSFPSPYDSLCKSVVEQYLPTVLQWIEQGIEALDICTKIGLCSTTKSIQVRKIVLPKNYNNGIGCDMCTQVIQYIEKLLADQTVEEDIAALIDQLCTRFPSPYDTLCKTVVDNSLELILKLLEQGLEALDICTRIGLCTVSQTSKISVKKIALPKNYNNGFGCDMCTKVIQYVEQLLKDQTVESEIATLVEQLCNSFPSPYDSLCKSVVEQYLPTVLQWIEQGIEALDICTKIGLCSTTKSIQVRKIVLPKNYNNGFGCDMCTKVIQYVEQLLKDQTVESEIATLVEQLCNSFPSPYDSLCKSVVEQYLPTVLQWIEQGIEALDICTKIGLCSTTKSIQVRKIVLPKNYNNGIGCDMCTQVIQYIEKLLVDQTIETDIEILINEQCDKFASPYDTLCKTVVDNSLELILKLLEQGLEALDICTRIGLCTVSQTSKISVKKIALPKNYNNGFGCDMCTKVIQYVEQLLKDQTVESEIATLVEQLCNSFPSPYDSLCKSVVEQYLPTVLQWIEQGIEALDICTKIGLCSTTKSIQVRKIVLPKNYNNGFGCDMCTKVIQYVEQLLKDQTVESEIATLVEQLCNSFPSPYDSLCKSVVEQYLPTVLQWIEQGIEALDICTKIGLCSTTKSIQVRKIVLPKNYNNGIGCDMCTQVIQYIEKLLADQTVEEDIAALIDQLCTRFPSPYDTLCKTVVDNSLELILKLLEQGLEALDICTRIGLCTVSQTSKISVKKIALPKNYNNGFGCDMCTKVIQYVEQLLKDQTVESEIATLVEQLCNSFPSPYDSLCKSVVEQYLPTVLQWIEQGIEALDICTKIGLCSTTKSIQVRKIVLPKNYNNGIGCDMCTQVIQYIEKLLADQTVEEDIAALIDQLCTRFPSPYDTLCKTVVDNSLELILQLLEEGLEALDICTKIGLCSASKAKKVVFVKKIALPKNYKNSFGCDMCTQVVKYVEQILADTTVESEIATLVEQLCNSFPSPYDSLCKTVVEQYLPTVLQWIEQGIEALDICTKIGLCTSSKFSNVKKVINVKKIALPKNYNNGLGCDMCTQVVTYIEKLLADETVEDDIGKFIDQLCTQFPSPYDTLCKTIVDQSLKLICQLLEQGLEALDICTKIGLCTATKAKKAIYAKKIVIPASSNYQNSFGCDMCTKVINYIETLLKDQTVEEEIAALVEQLCATFSSPYDSLCKTVVAQYLPSVLQWLEQDLEALDICTTIGLCPKTEKKIVRFSQLKSEEGCETCKKWFKWAGDKFEEITVEGLWKLISEECPKVPYLKYFCEIINEQNIDTIVNLIRSALPPEQCCAWIKVC